MIIATGEKLSQEIDVARWEWLKPHFEREALLVISKELELAEVGERLAADDAVMLQRWLASHLIAKPTPEQAAAWENNMLQRFNILIVSPFVLIQEM